MSWSKMFMMLLLTRHIAPHRGHIQRPLWKRQKCTYSRPPFCAMQDSQRALHGSRKKRPDHQKVYHLFFPKSANALAHVAFLLGRWLVEHSHSSGLVHHIPEDVGSPPQQEWNLGEMPHFYQPGARPGAARHGYRPVPQVCVSCSFLIISLRNVFC